MDGEAQLSSTSGATLTSVNGFLKQFAVGSLRLTLRPLVESDREALLNFARGLPRDDLLFLRRDITQPSVVDEWIESVKSGRLFTVVALDGDAIVGYATFDRRTVPWTRHVAELRVGVAVSARGNGVGQVMLELVFEKAMQAGVTKVMARVTADQIAAISLFERLGFEQEAVLRGHAVGLDGCARDLLVLSYHAQADRGQHCDACTASVLKPLLLEGAKLCARCYEARYAELGTAG